MFIRPFALQSYKLEYRFNFILRQNHIFIYWLKFRSVYLENIRKSRPIKYFFSWCNLGNRALDQSHFRILFPKPIAFRKKSPLLVPFSFSCSLCSSTNFQSPLPDENSYLKAGARRRPRCRRRSPNDPPISYRRQRRALDGGGTRAIGEERAGRKNGP